MRAPEQKPSLRQRHRLNVSKAESRIRLIVLLTAPKIFAISSITDKKIKPQFCKIVGLVFLSGKIQNSPCHSERIEESRGNETALYIRHFTSFRYREIATLALAMTNMENLTQTVTM